MSSYRCFDAVERIRRARDETAKVFGGIVQVVKAVFKEKTRLVDMYNEERTERRALMPPPKRSFWDFLRK